MSKQRTITMTDRPPVRIVEDDWPVIAVCSDHDGEVEYQANEKWSVRVREHSDGRRIVYGVFTTTWPNHPDYKAGILTDESGTILAIHKVTETIGQPQVAAEVISDLPNEILE